MNISLKALHDEKLDSLAEAYAREGFKVVKEPPSSQIPFDLDGYRPDLIVYKDGLTQIIEVKTSASRLSVDRLQWIAEEVAKHQGWRFLLVTLDDVDTRAVPTVADELPDWAQMSVKLQQADGLAQLGFTEPLLLYLCSIVEAGSRRRALQLHIPIERLPIRMLLKHLYSQGEVSMAQMEVLERLWELRNRLAHGAMEVAQAGFGIAALKTAGELIGEWSQTAEPPGAAETAQRSA